ncbi:MAG: hypothetical protein IIX54_00465 [Clostridia bacterium]|nr:hypothetical protein [Clostridia bacterium]
MEIRFILQTLFEIAVAAFIIYGLIFEDRFVETEKKVWAYLKRLFYRTFSENSYNTNHN